MVKQISEFATPRLGNRYTQGGFTSVTLLLLLISIKHGVGRGRLTHTRQRVAELRVRDKLPVVEPRHAVQVETVQADHVAVAALEYQDRAPAQTQTDVCSSPRQVGKAAGTVGRSESPCRVTGCRGASSRLLSATSSKLDALH